MDKVFRQMAEDDVLGGLLLIAAAVLAMIFANTGLNVVYNEVLSLPVSVRIGEIEIDKALQLWVNDGLMAIFFLYVGLEVKREFLQGHLSEWDQVVLPGVAAIAGVVFPALVYVAINLDDPAALPGWAIPSATDIAFALGIMAIFGKHLPQSLKLFLLSIAIFDDIAAILIIALFYSEKLSAGSLFVALIGIGVLFTLNRTRARYTSFYIVTGVIMWAAVLKSGVHATLAGFLLACFIPLEVRNQSDYPMLPALEHNLHPWVSYLILPFFAFTNAGVNLSGIGWDALLTPVTLGVILGLFIGKQAGIFGACWLVIRLNLARMPQGASWRQLYGVCLLAGIGFTMSLFIGGLAFEGDSSGMIDRVKLGVLIGSLLSAAAGAAILISTRRHHE